MVGARARLATALLVVTVGITLTACGESAAAAHAPTIQVVTGLYPLTQAVEQIGQGKVAVTDVVPAGTDPTTYRLTAAQVAVVHRAAVVVEIGGGFQPSFEAAALGAGAGAVVDLRAALGATDPYVWLDPVVMGPAGGIPVPQWRRGIWRRGRLDRYRLRKHPLRLPAEHDRDARWRLPGGRQRVRTDRSDRGHGPDP